MNLRGLKFFDENLRGLKFFGKNLRGLKIFGKNLRGLKFSWKILRGLKFLGENLRGLKFFSSSRESTPVGYSQLKVFTPLSINTENNLSAGIHMDAILKRNNNLCYRH